MSYVYDTDHDVWLVLMGDVVVRICDSEDECRTYIAFRLLA